jgi:hypothetical protein
VSPADHIDFVGYFLYLAGVVPLKRDQGQRSILYQPHLSIIGVYLNTFLFVKMVLRCCCCSVNNDDLVPLGGLQQGSGAANTNGKERM